MTNEELKRYADPRRYNLILTLGAGRLQAWFEPYGTRTEAPVLAITSTWTPQPEQTLKQIENAVYDNSLLLEDYDCRLLLDTPQQLLFPPEAPRQLIEEAMKRFYDVAPGDIFTRPLGDAVIAFSLCTGLRAFLGRTFAGVEARAVGAMVQRRPFGPGTHTRVCRPRLAAVASHGIQRHAPASCVVASGRHARRCRLLHLRAVAAIGLGHRPRRAQRIGKCRYEARGDASDAPPSQLCKPQPAARNGERRESPHASAVGF